MGKGATANGASPDDELNAFRFHPSQYGVGVGLAYGLEHTSNKSSRSSVMPYVYWSPCLLSMSRAKLERWLSGSFYAFLLYAGRPLNSDSPDGSARIRPIGSAGIGFGNAVMVLLLGGSVGTERDTKAMITYGAWNVSIGFNFDLPIRWAIQAL